MPVARDHRTTEPVGEKCREVAGGSKAMRLSQTPSQRLSGAAFAQGNSQIVFCGSGRSIPAADGEDGFPIYGSIAVDGSNLKLTKPSAYAMEEMQNFGTLDFYKHLCYDAYNMRE